MRTTVLAILDGFGYRKEEKGNAVKLAKTPNLDKIIKEYPMSLLDASGEMVGLPDGQMGNSEVGHLNIGAGRIVYQPLVLINKKIEDKSFFNNANFIDIINHVKKNDSNLHLMGLVSDGGVHSHINHLYALLKLCKQHNLKNVYIHVITDGRDTLPDKAKDYVTKLNNKIKEIDIGSIVSISGRFYAMDRDNRWDRIKKYYDTVINGDNYTDVEIINYIENSFKKEIYDEFIEPALFNKNATIKNNDSLIFFNFRSDRANQILTSITNSSFNEFERKKLENLKVVTMMDVKDTVISKPAFSLERIDNSFGEWVYKKGLKQLRIAETEKYNHVTYFFDGNKNIDYKNEKKILINSPKVKTYDLKPSMSANEITDKLIEELENEKYDFVILNFANCDMVGHTGILKAAIEAVETIDSCIGKIYKKLIGNNDLLIITADHGNSEYMIDEEGNPYTAHTTNKVPFIVCNKNYKVNDGKLADIIPSLFSINNIEIPKEMNGNIIIKKIVI